MSRTSSTRPPNWVPADEHLLWHDMGTEHNDVAGGTGPSVNILGGGVHGPSTADTSFTPFTYFGIGNDLVLAPSRHLYR